MIPQGILQNLPEDAFENLEDLYKQLIKKSQALKW